MTKSKNKAPVHERIVAPFGSKSNLKQGHLRATPTYDSSMPNQASLRPMSERGQGRRNQLSALTEGFSRRLSESHTGSAAKPQICSCAPRRVHAKTNQRNRGIQPDAPETIQAVLSSSPQITGVPWFTDEDYRKEENGQPTPS